MIGAVYLIINKKHLTNGKTPVFYIGSKKDIELMEGYWGSSKYIKSDIKNLGIDNFSKIILEKMEFNDVQDLLNRENEYQVAFNVIESVWFYNKTFATGPFHCDGSKHTLNTIWINNGKINKRVKEKDIQQYISAGFVHGRLNAKYNQKRIYINNGEVTKAVLPSELKNWLSCGWNKGRLRGNHQNKSWVSKNNAKKIIPKEDLEYFLNNGWRLGWKC